MLFFEKKYIINVRIFKDIKMKTGIKKSYSTGDLQNLKRSRSFSPSLRKSVIKGHEEGLSSIAFDNSKHLTDGAYTTLVELPSPEPIVSSRSNASLNKSMSEVSSISAETQSIASNLSTKKAMNKFINAVEKSEILDEEKLNKLKNAVLSDNDLTPEKFEAYVLDDISDRKIRRLLSNMIGQFIIKTDGGYLFTNKS